MSSHWFGLSRISLNTLNIVEISAVVCKGGEPSSVRSAEILASAPEGGSERERERDR